MVNGVAQKPMDGVSIASTLQRCKSPARARARSISRFSPIGPSTTRDGTPDAQHTFPWRQDYAPGNWDKDKWELYNLDEDFSEARDLASEESREACRAEGAVRRGGGQDYHVYPFDDRGAGRFATPKPAPGGADPNRTHFTYFSGCSRLAETAAANTKNRSHRITAEIEMPASGGQGVIVAAGGSSAGYALYVEDGRLVYHYNWFERERTNLVSDIAVPPRQVDRRHGVRL